MADERAATGSVARCGGKPGDAAALRRARHRAVRPAHPVRAARGALAALLLGLVGLVGGCGYTHEQMYPEQYRTVAVPIFENRTHYRHVETDLTEALVKEIERRTPYKVVPMAVADTVLQGAVVGVEQRQLSRRPRGGVPEELELTMSVDFEWRDRDGELLRSRRGFEAIGHYVPATPMSEPMETARHTAAQRMAEAIVSTMRGEW